MYWVRGSFGESGKWIHLRFLGASIAAYTELVPGNDFWLDPMDMDNLFSVHGLSMIKCSYKGEGKDNSATC